MLISQFHITKYRRIVLYAKTDSISQTQENLESSEEPGSERRKKKQTHEQEIKKKEERQERQYSSDAILIVLQSYFQIECDGVQRGSISQRTINDSRDDNVGLKIKGAGSVDRPRVIGILGQAHCWKKREKEDGRPHKTVSSFPNGHSYTGRCG